MLINCDIGERGVAHKIDDALMKLIDISNIACGGHAGDKESVDYYCSLAKENRVKISAHLSYPDKKNFGRVVLDISENELLKGLDMQYDLISDIKTLKLHGALYNEANVNQVLASSLIQWSKKAGITEVLTPYDSCVEKACEQEEINVLHEVFLDRTYIYENGILKLSPRSNKDALITDLKEAKLQYEDFLNGHINLDGNLHKLIADTGCIHSDSNNALEIAQALCLH